MKFVATYRCRSCQQHHFIEHIRPQEEPIARIAAQAVAKCPSENGDPVPLIGVHDCQGDQSSVGISDLTAVEAL